MGNSATAPRTPATNGGSQPTGGRAAPSCRIDNPAMHRPAHVPRPRSGFTLIELMIVVTVVIILAAVAWPSFMDSVRKGRRADALAVLARVMQAEERFRSSNPSYTDDFAAMAAPQQSSDRHYAVSIVDGSASPTGYMVQATAVSGSPQYADARCRVMRVEIRSGETIYSSFNGSGAVNAAPDPCWVK